MTVAHSLLAGLFLVAAAIWLCGSPRSEAQQAGRYSMLVTTPGSIARLNIDTGAVSACSALNSGPVRHSRWPTTHRCILSRYSCRGRCLRRQSRLEGPLGAIARQAPTSEALSRCCRVGEAPECAEH